MYSNIVKENKKPAANAIVGKISRAYAFEPAIKNYNSKSKTKQKTSILRKNLMANRTGNILLQYITGIMGLTENEIRYNERLLVNAFDQEHRVLFWNKKCEKLFGIAEEEALGKKLEDLLPWTGDHEKMVYLHTALSGQPVYIADDSYETKNGSYDQVVFPLKNSKGQVFAALNIVIDLKDPADKSKSRTKFSLLLNKDE